MTNPKTRKTRQAEDQNAINVGNQLEVEADTDEAECPMSTWNHGMGGEEVENSASEDEYSLTPVPNDLDDGDEVSHDTSSSFSLQECIDEFKARRVRRVSTQSREAVDKEAPKLDPADEDLINQNRSNKEHERKCKPCKNGFCYCFTSDSGDAMGGGPHRTHVRQHRRSRRSESSQVSYAAPQRSFSKEKRRQSAPCEFHVPPKQTNNSGKSKTSTACATNSRDQLTAISRLETSSKDAPLIHIIQELRNNCVISEVRVNKHKMQNQHCRSLNSSRSRKEAQVNFEKTTPKKDHNPVSKSSPIKNPIPSAPPLEKISELDTLSEPFVYSTSLNTSSKSNDSPNNRHKAAGRLLQKRLSNTQVHFKPRNFSVPPPKPPRCSFSSNEDKSSLTTLSSTSPSIREAERVVDDFLRSKGIAVPGEVGKIKDKDSRHRKEEKQRQNTKTKKEQETKLMSRDPSKRYKRKSYPLTQTNQRTQTEMPLPSCPSLSDIERTVDTKRKESNYEKNIRHSIEKPIREHSFGWKEPEPKIRDMLNYDANSNRREFKSQSTQAEPQSIGWQIPPKVDLDTVDGVVGHNLAANISTKNTPVKSDLPIPQNESQKFIFREQLKNFVHSPWSNKTNNSMQKKPKSSLKSSSRSFLNNSRKKILKLVSPKKDNKEPRRTPFVVQKTPLRSVGVQTSKEELRYDLSSAPQSPPGSYFSAVQTSQQSTTPSQSQNTQEPETNFDFSRTVHSPPKKSKTPIQRKLNFPLHGAQGSRIDMGAAGDSVLTKTYRSFHSDLDQDVTLSKMGYILSNIRAKLEASDDHAVRTFQEIERREQQSAGFDCPDGPNMRHQTRVDIHRNRNRNFAIVETEHDPIYSEIEEDSIHISSSPQFDNKTGVDHFPAQRDPAAIYAKVVKTPKKANDTSQQLQPTTSLAKCMRDSLRSKISLKPLPLSPPKCGKSAPSILSSTSETVSAPLSLSLNNIRVMEHNSPPKRNRNLSKSDLSLQRSEIFLENLCRSEIMIDASGLERLEKVDNMDLDRSYISINSRGEPNGNQISSSMSAPQYGDDCQEEDEDEDDDVSYEIPNDAEVDLFHTVGSNLGLSSIEPPHTINQSTPKKPSRSHTFMTKHFLVDQSQPLSVDISAESLNNSHHHHLNQSSSCPTTPRKLPPIPDEDQVTKACAVSLNEVPSASRSNLAVNRMNPLSTSTIARYNQLKNVLRKSLRKSKNFVKLETKRLSTSLSFPSTSPYVPSLNQSERHQEFSGSSFNLDSLFSLEAEEPVTQQLAKAVSICRQLPDLEISPEMVEAERLLLFSSLKRDVRPRCQGVGSKRPGEGDRSRNRFFIDAMRLPIKSDANQDLFFNYFYIGTFECDGVIRSTQSVECCNHEAIFRDCGIEFSCSDDTEPEVRCEIFMLRLRKVSTISLEPKKAVLKIPNLPTPASSLSSSCEEIVSRFRLHGSFSLKSSDLIPYEYVDVESKSSNKICLRSSTSCKVAVTPRTMSTNLFPEILVTGRTEVRFPKTSHSGFLNVQDPQNQHNWNRRWCTLDGLFVRVWSDADDMSEEPLMHFDLRGNTSRMPLECAARELCARPRSFCLRSIVKVSNSAEEENEVPTPLDVFFSAECQPDLASWLSKLNEVLEFIAKWMRSGQDQ